MSETIKPMKKASPNFGQDVFGFVDVLVRLWDPKVKGQGHSKPKTP